MCVCACVYVSVCVCICMCLCVSVCYHSIRDIACFYAIMQVMKILVHRAKFGIGFSRLQKSFHSFAYCERELGSFKRQNTTWDTSQWFSLLVTKVCALSQRLVYTRPSHALHWWFCTIIILILVLCICAYICTYLYAIYMTYIQHWCIIIMYLPPQMTPASSEWSQLVTES